MRKILMMAVLAFLSLQGVGARASGISLLESGKKKLVAQEDTVKKDTVKKVTAYEKLLKDGGSECLRYATSKITGILKCRILFYDGCCWL